MTDPIIRLTLRPLPSNVPWYVRIRWLLKYAKRALDLKCEKAENLTPISR